MIILPALDMKDGKVVRLYKGDFNTVHQVAEDPVETALAFRAAGAAWIHMVDLDGARDGRRKNGEIVQRVAGTGLQIELGGGIRSMEDLDAVFAMGVQRAVIGSAAVSDPDFVAEAAARYGGKIAVGVDAMDGKVRIAGWTENSGQDYLDFSRKMEDIGVQTLIFTDIETDGALTGPSLDRLQALQGAVQCQIIASGGVSSNQDIRNLRDLNVYGAIIGKAYYAGLVNLAQAIQDAEEETAC